MRMVCAPGEACDARQHQSAGAGGRGGGGESLDSTDKPSDAQYVVSQVVLFSVFITITKDDRYGRFFVHVLTQPA